MKAAQVAEIYNVKSVTVRAWLKRGLFPNAKLEETIIGRVWLVPRKDLKNFQKPLKGRPADKSL